MLKILKINKVHSFFVGIMMLVFLFCCSSQAQAEQSGDYTYSVTDGKAEITKYTGDGGVVTIPSTLGGFPVTSIGDDVFELCAGLTGISIPQGVTSISNLAFRNCTDLTSITVAVNNLNYKSLEGVLFNKAGTNLIACPEGLTSIGIPQGVISIGNFAFRSCGRLTNINIPQGVTNIGKFAFVYCTGLTSISIPQGVTSIGDGTFCYCEGLTSISIPQGLESIGDSAFFGCKGLTSISIPQEVTSIGGGAFDYCTGLTSITVAVHNLNYKSLEGVLFNKAGTNLITCPGGLKSINIPQGVVSIGGGAFFSCTGLTSIKIPQGVKSIGDYAFTYCTSLTSISLPQGVPSISKWAFAYCAGLTSINIPQGVINIDELAFFGCEGLTSISLPQSLVSIGDRAFSCCTGLTSINLPQSVKSINGCSFIDCTDLTSITFNSATTTIFDWGATIPARTTIIGYSPSTAKEYASKYKRAFRSLGSAPIAITGVRSKTLSSSEIDLTWKAVKGNKYNVYRSDKKDAGYELIAGSIYNATYKDTVLKPETTYWYKITALNTNNVEGPASTPLSATTKAVGPKKLVAKVAGSSEITLSWDQVSGANSYNIYSSTSDNGIFKKVGSTSTTGFNNIKLKASTSYWYKVTTITAGGESDYSNSKSATTQALAPSGVKAKTVSGTSIALTWTLIKGNTYNIYRSTIQNGVYKKVAQGLNNASYNDQALTPGTKYWYKVTTLNAAKVESAASTPVMAVTKASGPSNLKSLVISKNEIDLSWNSMDGVKSYNIYRATSKTGRYSKVGSSKTKSFKNITGLKHGTTYWYKVTAVTSTGEGDYSKVVSATTNN